MSNTTSEYQLSTKYGSLIPDDEGRARLAALLGRVQAESAGSSLHIVQNTRDMHETLIFGPNATPAALMDLMAAGVRRHFGEGPVTVRLTHMFLCPKAKPDDSGYGLLMLSPDPMSEEYRQHANLKADMTALSPADTRDVGTLRMREWIATGASPGDAAVRAMLPHFTLGVDPTASHADFVRVWPALADGGHVPVDVTIRCNELAVSGKVVGTADKFLLMRAL